MNESEMKKTSYRNFAGENPLLLILLPNIHRVNSMQ